MKIPNLELTTVFFLFYPTSEKEENDKKGIYLKRH